MYEVPVAYYVIALLINIRLAFLIAEYLGTKRNIGFGWSMFLSILLGPLLGLIITLLSRKKISA